MVTAMRSAKRDYFKQLRRLALYKAFANSVAIAVAPYLQFRFINGIGRLPIA